MKSIKLNASRALSIGHQVIMAFISIGFFSPDLFNAHKDRIEGSHFPSRLKRPSRANSNWLEASQTKFLAQFQKEIYSAEYQ